jgi:large subunit ribosomal protein L6
MSNFTRLDIYKPEILNFEMQQFRNSFVCWFSGPYSTRKVQLSNRFPLEVLRGKLRFRQSAPRIGSKFYKTYNRSNLQHLHQRLSLLHVYLKQWMIGSSVGFKNALRVRGVGYKFSLSSTQLIIQAGYSHILRSKLPSVQSIMTNKKSTLFQLKSDNLVQLNTFLSRIRNLHKPDVYKGKGIRYRKDVVRKKEGKKKKTS